MRKDFLVDPYQLLEAREAGAGGALLIVRMLSEKVLEEMLEIAASLGLFVLLETFDAAEVAIAERLAAHWKGDATHCLIGVNSRDLVTLKVVPERLDELASCLPRSFPRVAESGLQTPSDAARLAGAGYSVALVGTALMSASDPIALASEMIRSGRSQAQA
jgi:indole-3-glycerol phosphate synthase